MIPTLNELMLFSLMGPTCVFDGFEPMEVVVARWKKS